MRSTRTIIITEIALAIALAAVLNFLHFRLPINLFGGSISLCMLPIALVALRRGPLAGLAAGGIFGCINLLVEPYILMPIQVILDYPLPYLLFGVGVGLFSGLYNRVTRKAGDVALDRLLAQGSIVIIVSLIFGGLLRFASHVVSGVVFFGEYAADFFASNPTFLLAGPVDAGLNLWIYSMVYNLTYLVPSLVGSAICLIVIAPVLAKAVPVRKFYGETSGAPQQAAE
ncbi:MAG: energy-coupled thiamine transporter ThiT [Coriobacteriia bacterium]|nr:energy-coupled thiamine transporter ThiT [Coriobacteriia bacterium]MCL2750692.1 energy-coupled thiamine transporter ThiT [Coriobacteriia bacterium]